MVRLFYIAVMNREIKFRGLRTDVKGWVYGYYVFTYNRCYIIENEYYLLNEDNSEDNFIEVIPESVGQYTGLKDKDGKDIYEGDIMEVDNYRMYSNKSKIVQWDNDLSCYVFKSTGIQSTRICLATEIEVIGNIHEHKHLLK